MRVQPTQKLCEVLLVGGLEQPFGIAAALEPDQRRKRRVWGELSSNSVCPELVEGLLFFSRLEKNRASTGSARTVGKKLGP
jgi:hypothetical protein